MAVNYGLAPEFPDGSNPVKADIRTAIQDTLITAVDIISDVTGNDHSGTVYLYLGSTDTIYELDPSDTTTTNNNGYVLVDTAGNRFKAFEQRYGVEDLDNVTFTSGDTAIIQNTQTISADLTVPEDVQLIIWQSGQVNANAGTETLTINGPFEAGPYQCFGSTLTVLMRDVTNTDICNSHIRTMLPEWFPGSDIFDKGNNALSAGGRLTHLTLPPGESVVSTTLNMNRIANGGPGDNLHIEGQGVNTTVIKVLNGTGTGIDASGQNESQISNFRIFEETGFRTVNVIHFGGTSFVANNVWASNSQYNWYVNDAAGFHMYNIRGEAGDIGFYVDATGNVRNGRIWGGQQFDCDKTLAIEKNGGDAWDIIFSNFSFKNSTGNQVESAGDQIVFANCYNDGAAGNGYTITGLNNSIDGGILSDCAGTALSVQRSDLSVNNVTFDSNATDIFFLSSANVDNFYLTNCNGLEYECHGKEFVYRRTEQGGTAFSFTDGVAVDVAEFSIDEDMSLTIEGTYHLTKHDSSSVICSTGKFMASAVRDTDGNISASSVQTFGQTFASDDAATANATFSLNVGTDKVTLDLNQDNDLSQDLQGSFEIKTAVRRGNRQVADDRLTWLF